MLNSRIDLTLWCYFISFKKNKTKSLKMRQEMLISGHVIAHMLKLVWTCKRWWNLKLFIWYWYKRWCNINLSISIYLYLSLSISIYLYLSSSISIDPYLSLILTYLFLTLAWRDLKEVFSSRDPPDLEIGSSS